MLPNLIIIGAGKAGTTSLHYYLQQHPEISMSPVKEANFFQRPNWRERIDWYQSLFAQASPIRGEASPTYSVYPVKREVPQRIRELIPDAKLIYLVRDPVERLVAHYSQHLANGRESRSLSDAVRASLDGRDAPHAYLAGSSYATQLEQYLRHFPDASIQVIDNVELRERTAETMRRIFAFLGVDPDYSSGRFGQALNTRNDQVRFGRVGRKLERSALAQQVRAHVPREVRAPVTKPLTRLLSQQVARPILDPPLREELRDRLAPEVERLRRLTGKRFVSWSV